MQRSNDDAQQQRALITMAAASKETMKKFVTALLFAALPSTLAAPALVWKNNGINNNAKTAHRSDEISSSKMLENALNNNGVVESSSSSVADNDNLSVVFLVGRRPEGTEGLSALTMEGSLPGVAEKYESCETVHHHVSKMESLHTVTNDVKKASSALQEAAENNAVLQVSLEELSSKLESLKQPKKKEEEQMEVGPSGMISKAVQSQSKRARALEAARVLIVDVPSASTDASRVDSAVVSAIDSKDVSSVVLSAIRSTDEVKHERDQLTRRRMMAMEEDANNNNANAASRKNRRRLDDANQQQDDGNNNNNNDQDLSGIYYVHMTPNILAGLLFALMFIVTTWIGVSCMGMITGQDCYVSKMPTIGREA